MPVPLVFSRAAIRQLDRLAVDEFGVPSIVLMENAALGVAGALIDRLRGTQDRGVVICCGRGNNGGDGLAAARHLHNAGIPVALTLVAETWDYVGDAGTNAQIALRLGLPMQVAHASRIREAFSEACRAVGGRPAALVDAVAGTGLARIMQPGAVAAHLVAAMNDHRRRHDDCVLLAVDLPTGVDADTGRPLIRRPDGTTTAVHADVTVTFVGLKRGMLVPGAHKYLGEVLIADIGAPVELARRLGAPLPLPPLPARPAGPAGASRSRRSKPAAPRRRRAAPKAAPKPRRSPPRRSR